MVYVEQGGRLPEAKALAICRDCAHGLMALEKAGLARGRGHEPELRVRDRQRAPVAVVAPVAGSRADDFTGRR